MNTPAGSIDALEIVDSMHAVEFDPDAGLFRATYDRTRDRASLAVVAAVAVASSTTPVDLEPLHTAVETAALDSLFPGSVDDAEPARISFPYEGFEVTVSGAGAIEIDPQGKQPAANAPDGTTGVSSGTR
ncbi:hypothetical protein NP511_17285 [Natrinema thermotolerans]|uniref:Halobacterial output domain-containing protein n=1 Tax=Natrinema thermotolerans TaxID=121872 RepID=A0AAF0T0R8_9EURY|nr:HalOD1 output domain-containing protein [Natrinema thermotolerans]WMT07128.1 hypothetical protein NP511_17285 [Natrinema thermotolerans]